MSSKRFPGKALFPFKGRPLLQNIIETAARVVGRRKIMVATSVEKADDAIEVFANDQKVKLFRGSLNDVWSRFENIAHSEEVDWIGRICGDSPLLKSSMLLAMIHRASSSFDIVTNIFPRSFPHGQSFEIIRKSIFLQKSLAPRTQEDREHVTPHLYRLPGLRILNHKNPLGDQSHEAWSVEEPGDIERLEKL